MEPVQFTRSPGAKKIGCLAYLVAGLVAAFALALLIGMIPYGLAKYWNASENAAGNAFAATAAVIFPLTLVWSWRD